MHNARVAAPWLVGLRTCGRVPKVPFITTQLNSTQLNWTQLTQLNSVQPISAKQVSRGFVYDVMSYKLSQLGHYVHWWVTVVHAVNVSTTRRRASWVELCRYKHPLTCASLYCTFRPLLPTAHIAQWQDSPASWHRSWVRIPWWYYNFIFFYLLRFLSHFSLYYLPLIQLTSISVIIYICWPYESYFRAIMGLPHTHALCMTKDVVRYVGP